MGFRGCVRAGAGGGLPPGKAASAGRRRGTAGYKVSGCRDGGVLCSPAAGGVGAGSVGSAGREKRGSRHGFRGCRRFTGGVREDKGGVMNWNDTAGGDERGRLGYVTGW